MTMLRTILAATGLLLAADTALAADLHTALQAIKTNDYATAVTELKPLAEHGNAEAQTLLASLYQFGQGVPQDSAQGQAWMQKAADQGYAYAEYQLGSLYRDGAVSRDFAQAVHWYGQAATQGYARAQTNLGALYEKGSGVPLDHAQSAALFRKGAAGGDPVGFFDLGVMYANGGGVPRDPVAAYALLSMSVAQYDINQRALKADSPHTIAEAAQLADMTNQKNAIAGRDKVATMLTPAQLDLARALVQQMASNGVSKTLDARFARR
jgi:TPR repeat protein